MGVRPYEQPPEFTPENINTLFLLAQDFLCILGNNGSIQFFNPAFARKLGYRDEELLTKYLYDLLHPEDRTATHASTGQLSKFPVILPSYRYACKNGSYCYIQWSFQYKYERIYAIGTDMTDQRKSEAQLGHSEREQIDSYVKKQTDFIAHLCHEIRNPLTGIYGNLEIVEDDISN